MATISRIGYGQVEPNYLSAQRSGHVWASLPALDKIKQLENGQFVKYDRAAGCVHFADGDADVAAAGGSDVGEWCMVWNEVKLYDDRWRESYKDFAMIADNYTEDHYYLTVEDRDNDENRQYVYHAGSNVGPLKGQMVPRVIRFDVNDSITTNTLKSAGARNVLNEGLDLEVGNLLYVNKETGFLDLSGDEEGPVFTVVRVWTMPDGQPGVKIQRIK